MTTRVIPEEDPMNVAHTLGLPTHEHASRAEERTCEAQAEEQANRPKFPEDKVINYLASGGTKCIACESEDIGGGSVTIEAGHAYQNVTCNDCHAEWTDEYKLTNVTERE